MNTYGKITEKQFIKALVSSVCSILLCMACLVGTSWAWFNATVEVDDALNVATWNLNTTVTEKTTGTAVTPNGKTYSLPQGVYTLSLNFTSDATGDSFTPADTVFVVMQQVKGGVTEKFSIKLTLTGGNATYTIPEFGVTDAGAELSFFFTRMDPGLTDLSSVSFALPAGETTPPAVTEAAQQETTPTETTPTETTPTETTQEEANKTEETNP